jgi:hypothetical protein
VALFGKEPEHRATLLTEFDTQGAKMITNATLYALANALGVLSMIAVMGYHFVAVNARYIAKNGVASNGGH